MKHRTDQTGKILLATFVHPGVLWNLSSLKLTILEQTNNDFEVLVVFDGVTGLEVELPSNWKILFNEYNLDIPILRYMAIQYAVNHGYEYIVFLDADDTMSKTRIDTVLNNFADYDFVVNDIIPVDKSGAGNGSPVLKELLSSSIIDDYTLISEKNFIGFSNSAIRVSSVKDIRIPSTLIAVDWYLFSVILLQNGKGCFTEEAITFYTQHDANTAGLSHSVNADMIGYYLDVKLRHFYNLELYTRNTGNENYERINNYLIQLLQLKKLLEGDEALKKYEKLIEPYCTEFRGWWAPLKVSSKIINELVSKN